MMCMNNFRLMGGPDAAKRLGVTRATVNRWAEAGRIPALGRVGERGIWVFDHDAIERVAMEEK